MEQRDKGSGEGGGRKIIKAEFGEEKREGEEGMNLDKRQATRADAVD